MGCRHFRDRDGFRHGRGRRNYLLSVKTALADDLSRFRSIIARLERSDVMYTADKVVELFSSPADCGGFVSFARQLIKELKQIGKRRTAETYTTVLNSFLRFRGERDLLFGEVDSNLMVEYETFLKGCDVCPNSSSFTCVTCVPFTTVRWNGN